jgi:hypothetical protein
MGCPIKTDKPAIVEPATANFQSGSPFDPPSVAVFLSAHDAGIPIEAPHCLIFKQILYCALVPILGISDNLFHDGIQFLFDSRYIFFGRHVI